MQDILNRLLKFRKERDWGEFHTPKNLAISISIEAAELLEHFQWLKEGEELSPEKKGEVAKELADVFIYLLMLCNDLDIDLLIEAEKKIEDNAKKYPVEKARGGLRS